MVAFGIVARGQHRLRIDVDAAGAARAQLHRRDGQDLLSPRQAGGEGYAAQSRLDRSLGQVGEEAST